MWGVRGRHLIEELKWGRRRFPRSGARLSRRHWPARPRPQTTALSGVSGLVDWAWEYPTSLCRRPRQSSSRQSSSILAQPQAELFDHFPVYPRYPVPYFYGIAKPQLALDHPSSPATPCRVFLSVLPTTADYSPPSPWPTLLPSGCRPARRPLRTLPSRMSFSHHHEGRRGGTHPSRPGGSRASSGRLLGRARHNMASSTDILVAAVWP